MFAVAVERRAAGFGIVARPRERTQQQRARSLKSGIKKCGGDGPMTHVHCCSRLRNPNNLLSVSRCSLYSALWPYIHVLAQRHRSQPVRSDAGASSRESPGSESGRPKHKLVASGPAYSLQQPILDIYTAGRQLSPSLYVVLRAYTRGPCDLGRDGFPLTRSLLALRLYARTRSIKSRRLLLSELCTPR